MSFTFSSRWRSVIRCLQIRLTGQIQKEIKSESMSTNHCLSMVLQGSNPTLSISKIKAASYLDFGLELLVSEQMWIDDIHDSLSRRKDVRTHMQILSVVKIKAYSRNGYDYLSEIVLRRADFQEHTMLSTAVKLWTRNLVIRQRVEEFQLGIESYHT
ncbi:hypothetical protein Tco_1296024 [Tanacetum coccineum]